MNRFAPILLLLLAACGSTQKLPDPAPGTGQIVVRLEGAAREGVRGPAREDKMGEYEITSESVEKGRDFERVNYSAIEDVVVLCNSGSGPARQTLPIGPFGPERRQLAMSLSGSQPAVLQLNNRREGTQTIWAVPRDEWGSITHPAPVLDVSVAAKASAELKFSQPGVYDLYCDEDEYFECTVYVVVGGSWTGPSNEAVVFNNLNPGNYELIVIPPRLPVQQHKATVAVGQRSEVKARLTVNALPRK
jgi:hypothetical protein